MRGEILLAWQSSSCSSKSLQISSQTKTKLFSELVKDVWMNEENALKDRIASCYFFFLNTVMETKSHVILHVLQRDKDISLFKYIRSGCFTNGNVLLDL